VKTHFRQVERDAGVGGAQLWALSVIERMPGIGATGLARELDIHQSTASNLIKGLVARGLVATTREGNDRRGVALRVLPPGADVLARAPLTRRPKIGIGAVSLTDRSPATLPGMRVRTGRFE
jgi:DNA-binding MarR family transcriptional regulator